MITTSTGYVCFSASLETATLYFEVTVLLPREIPYKKAAVSRNYWTCAISDYFNNSVFCHLQTRIFYFQVQESLTSGDSVFRHRFKNFNVYLRFDFNSNRDCFIHLTVIIPVLYQMNPDLMRLSTVNLIVSGIWYSPSSASDKIFAWNETVLYSLAFYIPDYLGVTFNDNRGITRCKSRQ